MPHDLFYIISTWLVPILIAVSMHEAAHGYAAMLLGDDPDKVYFEKVWDRKMGLRMKYVRERSFLVDLKLIFLTFATIFKRK